MTLCLLPMIPVAVTRDAAQHGRVEEPPHIVLEAAIFWMTSSLDKISNTCFTKVDSKKVTYESDGNRSVIVYILVRTCQRQMVSDITVINGVPCIQQHKLLLCKVVWSDKCRSREKGGLC